MFREKNVTRTETWKISTLTLNSEAETLRQAHGSIDLSQVSTSHILGGEGFDTWLVIGPLPGPVAHGAAVLL